MAEFNGIPPDTSSSVFCLFSIPEHKEILLSANPQTLRRSNFS